jgi:glutaredoxin
MNKIKLLLLEDCKRCKNLKDHLNKKGIDYDYEVCKSDTEICDSIEDMIGCSNYPIVLKLNSLYNIIEEVAYITDNYEEVGKTKLYNDRIKLNMFYSIDKLIEYIIND